MSIGTIIKKLRHEKDMTQEQLAEYLSISSQAISRWETDIAMPDIMVLPKLANIFNVTTDYLLGVDIANKQAKIEAYCKESSKFSTMGDIDSVITVWRRALDEFPNNYFVMEQLSTWLLMKSRSETEGKKKHLLGECRKLAEKIKAECTADYLRHGATSVLCTLYSETGDYENAKRIVSTMPDIMSSRNILYLMGVKEDELIQGLQNNIRGFVEQLGFFLNRLADIKELNPKTSYTLEEKIALLQKGEDLYHLFYDNDDLYFYNERLMDINLGIACVYAKLFNAEKSLYHLLKALDYAVAFDTRPMEHNYFSLALNRLTDAVEYSSKQTTDNNCMIMLKVLRSEMFDFIRNNEKFMAIELKLKEYAR